MCRRATLQDRQQEYPLSSHGRSFVEDGRISVNQFGADRMNGGDADQKPVQKAFFIQPGDSAREMSVPVFLQHVLVRPLPYQVSRKRRALPIQVVLRLSH